MNAKELKSRLTEQHILILLKDFGLEPKNDNNDNELMFRTLCHGGDTHKLYFYRNTLTFHCYTNCGSMDILQLIQNIMNIDLKQSIEYIKNRFNFEDIKYFKKGFGIEENEYKTNDWNLINKYIQKTNKQFDEHKNLEIINENILNLFYDFYHISFLKDNISIETMKKYNIKFDIENNRIIIPHYNIENELIAIRCRNLDAELVSAGKKYMPIFYKGKILSSPITQYFFGLNYNKETIQKMQKVILFESEKSVLQMDSMFGDQNISLALSSSNLSDYQINILKNLGIKEVILALDKEFENIGTKQESVYYDRIKKSMINRLRSHGFTVSVLWDFKGLLKYKDSPSDLGMEVFMDLYNNRSRKMTSEVK